MNQLPKIQAIEFFFVDVLETKDVHPYFNVSSVPTLVELKSANAGRQLKGCHDKKILESFINHSMYNAKSTDAPKPVKKVTVYSTPTCPHCTTLKNYLKDHKINFTDIDLSKNSKAAEDLVRRSGQQGVPQTDINGKIIVGFDKKKIDEMLEIK